MVAFATSLSPSPPPTEAWGGTGEPWAGGVQLKEGAWGEEKGPWCASGHQSTFPSKGAQKDGGWHFWGHSTKKWPIPDENTQPMATTSHGRFCSPSGLSRKARPPLLTNELLMEKNRLPGFK